MKLTVDEARAIRALLVSSSEGTADKEASMMPMIFPRLTGDGSLIKAGARICWPMGDGCVVKRAAVDLWDRAENTPDAAPALWEEIAYRAGERVIPAVISATNAFAKGELGWWGDVLKRSKIPANVWNPDVNPSGWEDVET